MKKLIPSRFAMLLFTGTLLYSCAETEVKKNQNDAAKANAASCPGPAMSVIYCVDGAVGWNSCSNTVTSWGNCTTNYNNISCNPTLNATVTGGTPPYYYIWESRIGSSNPYTSYDEGTYPSSGAPSEFCDTESHTVQVRLTVQDACGTIARYGRNFFVSYPPNCPY